LVLLLVLEMSRVQAGRLAGEQGRGTKVALAKVGSTSDDSMDDSADDSENQQFHQELNKVIRKARARNRPHSGHKLLKAIERVVLRHSCVKMDSDEIIYILKQGRENDPKIKKQLHELRKTLSRRAMLCRLKRVRWRPIKIQTLSGDHGNKRQRARGTDASLDSILAQMNEEGTVGSVQTLLGGKTTGSASGNPLATLACRRDVPHRQLVPDGPLLTRLLSQMKQSGCWTPQSQSLYRVVEGLAGSSSPRHARITARAWCALMRRFDQCRTQKKTPPK
jgi:hypothetical protein